MKKVWGAIKGITPEMMGSMVCSMIGGLAPAAIGTALGVGAGRLAIQLANMVKRVLDTSGLLQKISKMKNLTKEQKADWSKEVGLCAVR